MDQNTYMQFIKLVPFLGKVMGTPFEIILFDVSDYQLPIIVSQNIKDSSVEKAREFVRSVMTAEDIETRDHWVNHATMIAPNKISKMSVYLIRDDAQAICAALVICMRCDDFFKMEAFFSSFLQFNTVDLAGGIESVPQTIEKQLDRDLSLESITDYILEFGVEPGRITHEEKREIICDLFDMGIYNLKGAVAKTAEELGMSTKSVYRYLKMIKAARE